MIGHLHESRWLNLLLAIGLAFFFWFYVRNTTDPNQGNWYNNVPVELTGTSVLTRQGLTVASLSAERVNLYLEAPLSVHSDLLRNRSDLAVTLDVSRCTEGENQLAYTPKWPASVNVDRISVNNRAPGAITVSVEKLYSRVFNVSFQFRGQVAGGYQAGTAAISPETVVVSGPAEQVNRIDKVAAILEEESLEEQFAGDLPLTLLDEDGNALTDLEVTMDSESAYVVLPVVVTKEIPLTVNLQPGGGATADDAEVYVEPETIIVSGPRAALEGLDEISLGAVDLSKVLGRKVINFPINLDPSLENVTGSTNARVEVSIDGLSTRNFDVRNIVPVGTPEGYTAVPVTQVRTVTIRGREEDLLQIDASQIRITVDMTGIYSEGMRYLPAQVYLNAADSVGVVGEYYVSLNVSR